MLAGIVGDVLGSVFEAHQWQDRNIPLVHTKPVLEHPQIKPLFENLKWVRKSQSWTDDTLCSLALYKAYVNNADPVQTMVDICTAYADPATGFGKAFGKWLENPVPYESYANGSIMRIGFIPYLPLTLSEKLELAYEYTDISHNHLDSQTAVHDFITLFDNIKNGGREVLYEYLNSNNYLYTVEDLHDAFVFEMNAKVTLLQAVVAILESTCMEEVYSNCFYIGGDSDTLACVAGNLASSIYETPPLLQGFAMGTLATTPELLSLALHFEENYWPAYSKISLI